MPSQFRVAYNGGVVEHLPFTQAHLSAVTGAPIPANVSPTASAELTSEQAWELIDAWNLYNNPSSDPEYSL